MIPFDSYVYFSCLAAICTVFVLKAFVRWLLLESPKDGEGPHGNETEQGA